MARTLHPIASHTYPQAAEAALRDVSATFSTQAGPLSSAITAAGKRRSRVSRADLYAPDEGTVSARLPLRLLRTKGHSHRASDGSMTSPATLLPMPFVCALRWKFLTTRRGDSTPLAAARQKKLQIAAALWRTDRVLVLDEPTNPVRCGVLRTHPAALRGFSGNRHPYFPRPLADRLPAAPVPLF